ncbi:MAG TPA: ATP-binding protein [Ktedonobacterales bacterium]
MSAEHHRPETQPTIPLPHSAPAPAGSPVLQAALPQTGGSPVLQAARRPVPSRRVVPQHPPQPAGRFSFLRSLRWRLALGFVAFLVVAMLLLAVFLVVTVRPYLRGQSLTNVEAAALRLTQAHKRNFESEVQVQLGQPSPAFEDTIGAALDGLTDVQQVLLVEPRSLAVAAALPDNTLVGQKAPDLDRALLLQKLRSGVDSTSYRSPDGNTGIILIGINCQSCTRAGTHNYVIEVLTGFGSVNTVIGRLLFLLAIGMAGLVVLAAIIGIPLIRRALRPLNRMTVTAQAIAAGDLSQRVNLSHRGDEIGALTSSFDEMVDRIEAAFAAQQESERRMRQFVGDASHELRTPLTSLRGFTDVLLRGAKDDPEDAEKVLRSMQRECERMSRLVHDLLTLARLDAGRQMNRQRFDLVELVGEAVDQGRILAGNRTVTMRSDGGGPLFIVADQDKIKQVLLILLDNALKYGRQGADGWVRVQISRTQDMAQLQVADNGQGIRAEDLPHIFERFYRADKTRSRTTNQLVPPGAGPTSNTGVLKAMNAGGSGLGLPIALAIIQAHGGSIWAQSQWGQGTQFTIQLPRQ